MITPGRPSLAAQRFSPLVGAAVGAVGGGIYWLGAQVWPTSIAVVLSMLATNLLSAGTRAPVDAQVPTLGAVGLVFAVLLKYNALMALSAASLPFPLPANVALGLIMIAANAACRALIISMNSLSHIDLCIALALGFAPSALIGLPGLVGSAAAIAARIALTAYARRKRAAAEPELAQHATELCFYLGALAARAYL